MLPYVMYKKRKVSFHGIYLRISIWRKCSYLSVIVVIIRLKFEINLTLRKCCLETLPFFQVVVKHCCLLTHTRPTCTSGFTTLYCKQKSLIVEGKLKLHTAIPEWHVHFVITVYVTTTKCGQRSAVISWPNALWQHYYLRSVSTCALLWDYSFSSVLLDHCRLPRVVGNCRAAFPRFYYDVTNQTCKPFIYGGCGANDNNFNTTEECEASCSGVTGKYQAIFYSKC